MVEFHNGAVIPVEYKRGKPKEHNADVLQLVLQCLCLEEMLCCNLPYGYLYYAEIRHRVKVEITQELRNEAQQDCKEMHSLFDRGYTPKTKPQKGCSACSLKELCLPKLMKAGSAIQYINSSVQEVADEKTTEYPVCYQ